MNTYEYAYLFAEEFLVDNIYNINQSINNNIYNSFINKLFKLLKGLECYADTQMKACNMTSDLQSSCRWNYVLASRLQTSCL